MAQINNDSTVPALHIGPEYTNTGATILSQQVNIMDRLQLRDPAKQTTTDLLQNSYINVTPLDPRSDMNDPHKFIAAASKMVDRAPNGSLTFDLLKETQSSPAASSDEKTVAKALIDQYPEVDPKNWATS